MKIGTALVKLLHAYGVDVIFGIPGTHSIELYRGLAESNIQHVLPRHEQGAGFMADGYARVSGKPGVCFVITGPGVTNIATAMAQAMSDSVPMLVISPVNDPREEAGLSASMNYGRLHELTDQAAVTRPFTRMSETATSVADIPELLGRAYAIFFSERPGPVHINIPLSLLRTDIDESSSGYSNSWRAHSIDAPVQVAKATVAAIISVIESARKPVMVAGGGCRHFAELVVSLAEKCACPVTTTVAGRGVIPGSHPLCLGAQTLVPAVQRFLAESDLIIVLGSELAEPDHCNEELILPERQIWLNLDPQLLQHRRSVSKAGTCLSVLADARQLVPELTRRLSAPDQETTRSAYARCKRLRGTLSDDFSPVQKTHWRVLTELKKALPADVCVFSDMTQLAYTAVEYMPLQQTNSWMHPNGYGTLGYALPAAIGAGFTEAVGPRLVIVGDAGFQYTLPELAVAAEYQQNLVVLLWQNNALMQIYDDMVDANFQPIAVNQPNPDFLAMADVYGWTTFCVAGLFELGTALETAFATSGPVLLELKQERV